MELRRFVSEWNCSPVRQGFASLRPPPRISPLPSRLEGPPAELVRAQSLTGS